MCTKIKIRTYWSHKLHMILRIMFSLVCYHLKIRVTLYHIYIYRLRRILRHAVLPSVSRQRWLKKTQPFNRPRPRSRTNPVMGGHLPRLVGGREGEREGGRKRECTVSTVARNGQTDHFTSRCCYILHTGTLRNNSSLSQLNFVVKAILPISNDNIALIELIVMTSL